MESTTSQDNAQRQAALSSELVPITVIRTETVLSRLPIHNLAKTGNVDISITRKNDRGSIELQWEVSYNSKYGQPRQLAYKLDTLVINRRIDEQRRPVPKALRLGSLNQICGDLDLNSSGKNVNNLKKAILQNAGAMVTAKLSYRAADGAQKRLEAVFTRYSVIFTGEQLPNGDRADGVYLVFNEPYWEVLNNAPVRPLDYDYLKQLPPAPQRFYEILSYRVFAALKNRYPTAKLAYSEYCTYSAQTRYFDHTHFKKQMYKVHRPHIDAQYISKVGYEQTRDADGNADWIMHYVPGPKAHAEYAAFQDRAGRLQETIEIPTDTPAPTGQPTLVDELIRRGVSPIHAQRLSATVQNEARALDQLDWGDHLIFQSPTRKFYNPPGFYVYLLRENITPPPGFETSRQRVARQQAEAQQNESAIRQLENELAYQQYVRQTVENYLAEATHQDHFLDLVERKQKELVKQYRSLALVGPKTLEEVAHSAAFTELSKQIPMMSLEEFCKSV